jgi:hypothetical protein
MPMKNDKSLPAAALERCLAEAARLGRGDAAADVPARDRGEVLKNIADATGPSPASAADRLYAEYVRQHARVQSREDLVDAGSEMSFPASDPPSYMGGASTAGGPPHDESGEVERANTRVSDPSEVKPATDDVSNPASSNNPEDATKRRR